MNLVGFGCSFTYGSELLDPELDGSWDRHNDNTPYREKHTWLGQLAERLDAKAINLAEPSSSNYSIQEKFAGYIYENDCSDTIICIGWTHYLRHSWWSDDESRWIHDGFIRYNDELLFKASFKEWLTQSYGRCELVTRHAKLFVNSVCKARGIRLIQFDALDSGNDKNNYPNYHQRRLSMKQCLEDEQKRLQKTFLSNGNHPNEAGHAYYVKLLAGWIRARKILDV